MLNSLRAKRAFSGSLKVSKNQPDQPYPTRPDPTGPDRSERKQTLYDFIELATFFFLVGEGIKNVDFAMCF